MDALAEQMRRQHEGPSAASYLGTALRPEPMRDSKPTLGDEQTRLKGAKVSKKQLQVPINDALIEGESNRAEIVRDAYAEAGRERHRRDPHREEREKLHADIRALAADLTAKHGRRGVANRVARRQEIQERAAAVKDDGRPYTVENIKKILNKKILDSAK